MSTTSDATAVVLLHDQFVQTGELEGLVPNPGPGIAWNPGATGNVNPVMVINTSISPVNNEVALFQTEPTQSEDIANNFGDQPLNATIYYRFDFRLPSADNTTFKPVVQGGDPDIETEGLWFATLRGTSASMTQRGRFGVVLPSGSGDFRAAISADNGNMVTNGIPFPTALNFDTTYRAVVSYNNVNASSKLWINPVDANSTSFEHIGVAESILTPAGTGTGPINRISLRQHNSYVGKQFVDNVVVATTFAEALNPITITGDFNGNGMVDAADYVLWRKSSGTLTGATVSQGDSDGDGDVDGTDYSNWRGMFHNAPGLGSGFSAVPEPATAVLIACVFAVCAFRRKYR